MALYSSSAIKRVVFYGSTLIKCMVFYSFIPITHEVFYSSIPIKYMLFCSSSLIMVQLHSVAPAHKMHSLLNLQPMKYMAFYSSSPITWREGPEESSWAGGWHRRHCPRGDSAMPSGNPGKGSGSQIVKNCQNIMRILCGNYAGSSPDALGTHPWLKLARRQGCSSIIHQ